jgi:hypothetical protein
MSDWIPDLLAGVGAVGGLGGIAGAYIARLARRDARAAEQSAAEARAGADSLEVSTQRMADSLQALIQMEERRWRRFQQFSDLGSPGHDPADDQRNLRPSFSLEYVRGHAYRLRNTGPVAATGVTISPEGLPLVADRLPRDVDLDAFRSTEMFILQGAMQAPLPGEVVVTCNELDSPAVLPIPHI